MLVPRLVRRLTLEPASHPRGQGHLSSASGLARVGHCIYVVSDDEHHLARLDADDPGNSRIALVRFVAGELPHEGAERKRQKPDVEVLLHLTCAVAGERDLLVLLGSGSRSQRERVFIMALHPDGEIAAAPLEIAATRFYAPLRDLFAEPNLEAGYFDGVHLHLFQRANRGQPLNARVTYDAAEVLAWLRGPGPAPRPIDVRMFELGSHDGVPFGITDAARWARGGCVFTAVAEDTADAYRDGACVASMVGWMASDGQVRACENLAGAPKVEGIAPVGAGRLWLVTDSDDPACASELLEVEWDPQSAHR